MNIIKLDATASTNTYLRELLNSCELENFTTVVTENQFAGRGQRGAEWVVEAGSNLTFSVLVSNFTGGFTSVFDLNVMIALSIVKALKKNTNLSFFIKWPNDIMSQNKKIGGILIENILKSDGSITSIVGIGINVNQTNFTQLEQASSLKLLSGEMIDKELLLQQIIEEIKQGYADLKDQKEKVIWREYKEVLFRKNKVSTFQLPSEEKFVGIIRDVTNYGKLVVQCEDNEQKEFAIKEIKLLY